MSSEKEPAVKKLDDEQIGELSEIFRSFDRNKDGSLTQLELGSLLKSLSLKPSEDQLKRMIRKADTNNNGLIEFSGGAGSGSIEMSIHGRTAEADVHSI
ncbi:Probable calcium-binding protein CML17 [Linum perenne]